MRTAAGGLEDLVGSLLVDSLLVDWWAGTAARTAWTTALDAGRWSRTLDSLDDGTATQRHSEGASDAWGTVSGFCCCTGSIGE